MFAATLSVLSGCSGASDVQSGSGPSTTSAGGGASSGTGGDGESTTTAPAEVAPSTSPYLFTQGTVTVPAGEAGKLSVVAISAPTEDSTGSSATVPVLVRNNTDTPLDSIEVNGTARGPDGALAGSGTSQNFEPNVLEPGQWGFAYIYFDTALPAGAKVEATASGNEPDTDLFDRVQLTINEVNLVPGDFSSNFVGILANTDGKKAVSSPGVAIGCFDPASNLIDVFTGYADGEAVPGGTASFSVSAYEAPTCAAIVAAASGFES